MANTVPMVAPTGFTGSITVGQATPPTSGQTYTPDANGMLLADPRDVLALLALGFRRATVGTGSKIGTADNGTTQTLTAAMVTGGAGGASNVFHTSAGGSTPTLTMPLGTALDTALPNMQVGDSFLLRVINNNSGIATVAGSTGVTLTGTATVTNATWREYLITKTATATYTMVNVGGGNVN